MVVNSARESGSALQTFAEDGDRSFLCLHVVWICGFSVDQGQPSDVLWAPGQACL